VSSIRPLATITVLAAVGIFLYLKINETEPPLPAGIEDWSADADLQFDMGGDFGNHAAGAAPPFSMSGSDMSASGMPGGVEEETPSFVAEPALTTEIASAVSSNSTSASNNMALAPNASSTSVAAVPVWTGDPVASAAGPAFSPAAANPSAAAVTAPPAFDNQLSASADTPQLPDLPPLPSLPPAASTAPVNNAGTETALIGGQQNQVSSVVTPPAPSAPALAPVSAASDTMSTLGSTSAPVIHESAGGSVPTSTSLPVTSAPSTQGSLFTSARLEVQAALDRGELSQALLLLSDWYGDPSLSTSETGEVDSLLSQLAGSVIYSTEHRVQPPRMVQAGERLESIAKEYQVPWQLLAKVNGLTSADQLQPGQKLKVVRGPFSAIIDISQRKLTLMLDRRYAGQFSLSIDPAVTVEEGYWEVNQKLLTPANVGFSGVGPTAATEERSLMLSSTAGDAKQVAILRGSARKYSATEPTSRVLRLNPNDAQEVFDILSLGSKVVIRR